MDIEELEIGKVYNINDFLDCIRFYSEKCFLVTESIYRKIGMLNPDMNANVIINNIIDVKGKMMRLRTNAEFLAEEYIIFAEVVK